MSRGTGVFHPRSQEERPSSTSAESTATRTTSNTHGRSRGSRKQARPAAGDARPTCAGYQAADTAQRTGPSHHAVTLRRVPWQQQHAQGASSRELLAVGSCPERLLMCQPRPPPPAARAAAGSAVQPAPSESSNSGQVLQQAGGAAATTPSLNSMLAPAACIPVPPPDSIGSTSHTPWSSSSSSSTLCPLSPAPAAGDSDQLLLPPRQGQQLPGALLAVGPQPAVDALPWPPAATQRLGAALGSCSSFHSLSLAAPLQAPSSQAVQAVAAVNSLSASLPTGGIWGGCCQEGSLAGRLFGGTGTAPQDTTSMCADNLAVFGSSAPRAGFSPMPSPCQGQQQLLRGSNSNSSLTWLPEPAWSGRACSPATAADTTLALSQLAGVHGGGDAAVHVAAAPAARTHSGRGSMLPSCVLGASLDSVVLGSSLDSDSNGLLSGGLRCAWSSSGLGPQQLQLANSSALSYAGISTNSPSAAPAHCSVPLSAHSRHSLPMGAPLLPSAAAAAVQMSPGCQMGGGAGMPLSGAAAAAAVAAADSNAMAVACAQLKLQQLLAVEQIQQQLQEEVLRLLPLI